MYRSLILLLIIGALIPTAYPQNIYMGGNGSGATSNSYIQQDHPMASIYTGGNGSGYFSQSAPLMALPVTLMNFEARPAGEKVRLHWLTATETNSGYFSIEKSLTGDAWVSIGSIKAAGNSNSLLHYEYFDVNPVAGRQFYRVKQTDADGTAMYSVIKMIVYNSKAKQDIIIYPNPVINKFTVQIPGDLVNQGSLKVINTQGQVMVEKRGLGSNTHVIYMTGLPEGWYSIIVQTGATIETISFLKQ